MAITDLKIVGKLTGGKVWGSNPYTSDSDYAVAAVHAGLVIPGNTTYIRVTDIGNFSEYEGTTANGVTTLDYSYPTPGVRITVLSTFRDEEITGSTTGGAVWGSNPYTVDSDISVAAVHAGLVLPGEKAFIRISDVGSLNNFAGSSKNGISTLDWSFPYDGIQLELTSGSEIVDTGYIYTYEDWYSEFSSSLLKNIDKTTAILIGKRIAVYYTTNTEVIDGNNNTWYGFYRKPDSEGLAYWTKEVFTNYGGLVSDPNFLTKLFTSAKVGSLDWNRIRTSNKNYLEGFGNGDFYDKGYLSENSYPGYPAEQLSLIEAEILVTDLYASIGRGPLFGTKTSEINETDYDYWVNRIISENLSVAKATEYFNLSVEEYIEDNPDDALTRYILSWRATQEELGAPSGPLGTYSFEITDTEESTYSGTSDGSSKVLWAGIKNSIGQVSIYSNPKNFRGDDSPLNSALSHLDRIYLDTRFDYLNIIAEADLTLNFQFRDVNSQGTNLITAYTHGLGYTPAVIIYDLDTNTAIAGSHFLQNINFNSFRIINVLTDSTSIFLNEKYLTRDSSLTSLSKTFKILVFNNLAGVV